MEIQLKIFLFDYDFYYVSAAVGSRFADVGGVQPKVRENTCLFRVNGNIVELIMPKRWTAGAIAWECGRLIRTVGMPGDRSRA